MMSTVLDDLIAAAEDAKRRYANAQNQRHSLFRFSQDARQILDTEQLISQTEQELERTLALLGRYVLANKGRFLVVRADDGSD